MRTGVGVDIAAGGVRVAVTRTHRGGSVEVRRLATVALPDGALVDGVIIDEAAVAQALRAALKAAGARRNGAVFAHHSTRAIAARMGKLGGIEAEYLETALRDGDEKVSPLVDLGSAVIATATPESDESGEVTIAAVMPAGIDALRALCEAAKVTPRAVDLSGAAILRASTQAPNSDTTHVALVDIGATSTTISIRLGRTLTAVQTLAVGADTLTVAVAQALGELSPATLALAELVKRDYDVDPRKRASRAATTEDPARQDALGKAADILIDHIAAAIDALIDANAVRNGKKGPLDGVVLLGGGSLLRGMAARFRHTTGTRADTGKPWAFAGRRLRTTDELTGPALLTTYAVAIGASMWRKP